MQERGGRQKRQLFREEINEVRKEEMLDAKVLEVMEKRRIKVNENNKRNTFVFTPIFHKLNRTIWDFFMHIKDLISFRF